MVNNAALNIGVHVFFQISVFIFFGDFIRSGIAGSYGSSILVFWETTILFSTVTASIYIPTNSVQEFPFLHILTNIVICGLFDDSHSDRCDVTSHWGFNLHFFDD